MHLLLRWIVGKYHFVYFFLCRKHITLESGHDNESLAKRVSNICRDKVINGCSPGWKQGWNGYIRDMFSKQFTAVKKTKNRNILYKCTYDTFYITTHYIYMQPHDWLEIICNTLWQFPNYFFSNKVLCSTQYPLR